MDKLNCIEEYFAGTKAYYLFWRGKHCGYPEWEQFILDKKYLIGAQIGCISNIMLGIKEDLVDNKGAFVYESKVFLKALENSVSVIATKVEDGYKVGNYIFPDATTLVAILRNKLAHGKYRIDFDHGRIILEHKESEIIFSLYKLRLFVMYAFLNTLGDEKKTEYERNIVYYTKKGIKKREKGLRDIEEVLEVMSNFKCINFKLESINGTYISKDCYDVFNDFLIYFKLNPQEAIKSNKYRKLCELLRLCGCKISYEYKKIDNKQDRLDVVSFIENEVLGNDKLSYEQQVEMLGSEIQRRIENKFNTFNPLGANLKNLVLLNCIARKNTVDYETLSSYMYETMQQKVKFHYDEFGMSLISMFNSLFMYPFDDIYSVSGEYKLDRSDGLDFGNLDLSMINPSVIQIDDIPLVNAQEKLDSIVKKQVNITKKLLKQQENLNKVIGNQKAETSIKQNVNDLRNSLALLVTDYISADNEYNLIKKDYSENALYFRNKAIIEGIRNSIAHGHYEFISNGKFDDTIIVFNDIYEGKLTFQAKISFYEFEKMINENSDVILNFINKKKFGIVNNVLVKK